MQLTFIAWRIHIIEDHISLADCAGIFLRNNGILELKTRHGRANGIATTITSEEVQFFKGDSFLILIQIDFQINIQRY